MAVQHQHRAQEHRPGLRLHRQDSLRGGVHPRHGDGLRQPPLLGRQPARHAGRAVPLLRGPRRLVTTRLSVLL